MIAKSQLFLKSENGTALILAIAYFVASCPLFLKVYETSREIIDEEFHLKQGKHFCQGYYGIWDEKITTFPGLYLITALLLPKKACTVFYMRALSLIFSAVNVFLIYKLKAISCDNKGYFTLALESISIAILPPMYFFAHLYYTDVMSICTVLGLYYFWIKDCQGKAGLCGFLSILMRQTNVVWVAMAFGTNALKIMNRVCDKKRSTKIKMKENQLKKTMLNIYHIVSSPKCMQECVICILKELWSYFIIICAFSIFVIYNGSIVVGDKSAHTASLHLPQLFYFNVFVLLFGIGFVLSKIIEILNFIKEHWLFMVTLLILGIVIVRYNTIVHPYLLADNRHYTFYVWNRFYSKLAFRYIMIPIYLFGTICVQKCLQNNTAEFQIIFHISLLAVLCFQRLLEIRYFIIPFIILKLNVNLKREYLIFEITYYLIINFLVFNVFFTKEIYWSDRHDVQRLLW